MVNIAIAGGTGNIGQTLVEVLKESPKHKVIVLSRKVCWINDTSSSRLILMLSTASNKSGRK
jgi:NAD dependent epimerase/dehydratase family enzyme